MNNYAQIKHIIEQYIEKMGLIQTLNLVLKKLRMIKQITVICVILEKISRL